MIEEKEIQNNFESKVSCKITSTSKGFNTEVHVYEGARKSSIDETVAKTVYCHQQLQAKLAPSLVG